MAKQAKTRKRASRPAQKAPAPAVKLVAAAAPVAKQPLRQRRPFDWWKLAGVLIIAATTLWIYWPALNGSWLWDDDYLLQKNDLIHDPEGLGSIWFAPTSLIDYFPLTVSVEWLEWQFFPDTPLCYHLTNVILHTCSALLLWHLLARLGVRFAWLGGFIFAIHPVMVESVAWMAEIKNTMSMPPFLLACLAWVEFDRRNKTETYFLALGLFLAAMLCKTTMVMFPVLILLYAWWKHDRITSRDILRTIPFFFISLAVSVALILLLRHGVGEETIPLGGIPSRLACAGTSLVFYFSRCFLPVLMLPIYPQWKVNPPELWQFLPWVLLAVAAVWLWTRRQPWARHILFGFGFFLLNLAPFVGFRAISFMRFAWVMDHILYLPILGLIGLTAAALGDLDSRLSPPARRYLLGGIAVVAVILIIGSREYAGTFVNSEAQWTYETQHFPNAWPPHNNLGNAYSDQGRLAEAAEQYRQALQINPGYPEAHNNLGIILAKTGHMEESVREFQTALVLCPELESAQVNLAAVKNAMRSAPAHKK
jgi:hypothetical protein